MGRITLKLMCSTGAPRVSLYDDAPAAHCGYMFRDTLSPGSLPACLTSPLSWKHLSDKVFEQEHLSEGWLLEEPRFEDRNMAGLPYSSLHSTEHSE